MNKHLTTDNLPLSRVTIFVFAFVLVVHLLNESGLL